MVSRSKIMVSILVVLCGTVIIVLLRTASGGKQPADNGPTAVERTKGMPGSPVHIVEYLDFQCPACAHGSHILKEYVAEHPGNVFWEMRYFPLKGHRHGMLSARYAECAARQKKFWPFVEVLLEKQPLWAQMIDAEPAFQKMAEQVNLNIQQLNGCLENDDVTEVIEEELNLGRQSGVRSTPTFFINEKMMVGSQYLLQEIKAQVSTNVTP